MNNIVKCACNQEVVIGDYIIKGVNGEFYPCKPDIFKKTYEEANNMIEKTEKTENENLKNKKVPHYELTQAATLGAEVITVLVRDISNKRVFSGVIQERHNLFFPDMEDECDMSVENVGEKLTEDETREIKAVREYVDSAEKRLNSKATDLIRYACLAEDRFLIEYLDSALSRLNEDIYKLQGWKTNTTDEPSEEVEG